jgi:plastocyanin
VKRPSATLSILILSAAMSLPAMVACEPAKPAAATSRSPDKVIYVPEPSTGPFVTVAVDNHFHDIHPVDHTRIAEDRPFILKNEGRNLHNFTVVGTSISVDVAPGHRMTWSRLGDHLPPGSYTVFCKYHAYLNMTGDFVVTP